MMVASVEHLERRYIFVIYDMTLFFLNDDNFPTNALFPVGYFGSARLLPTGPHLTCACLISDRNWITG